MQKWRLYVSEKGDWPGPVDNTLLFEQIEEKRKEFGYPHDESTLLLNDKTDYYLLSKGFYKHFYDLYDVNCHLVIKYMTKNEIKNVNGDALSASDFPQKYMLNGDEVIKGYDLSAIYENPNNFEQDESILKIRDMSIKVSKTSFLKRAETEYDVFQKFGSEIRHQKKYIVSRKWYNKWYKTMQEG